MRKHCRRRVIVPLPPRGLRPRLADDQLLGQGEPEMQQQLDLATRVLQRYGATERIGFSGPEYQLAKAGVDVMDQLASIVDRPTAIAAAEWSEARVNRLSAECRSREVA